jgi:hypothetical protein
MTNREIAEKLYNTAARAVLDPLNDWSADPDHIKTEIYDAVTIIEAALDKKDAKLDIATAALDLVAFKASDFASGTIRDRLDEIREAAQTALDQIGAEL